MINKKIINATPVKQGDIQFRSLLEMRIYNHLIKKGINPEYENVKCILWERQKTSFTVPYFDRIGSTFKQVTSKPLSITYTPDFTFKYRNWVVYLEVKGFKNDVTPYKIRLFRDWLEEKQKTSEGKLCYAVVKSIKDVNCLLDYLLLLK